MICHNCKAPLVSSQKFCPKCGTKVQEQPIPGPLASPPANQAGDALPRMAAPALEQPRAQVSATGPVSNPRKLAYCHCYL